MADQKIITLYQGDATPKDIVLRDLPVATVSSGTTIYLYQGDATAKDIILRDPTALVVTGKVDYVLSCSVGAYSYNGNDAILAYVAKVNYTLTCDAGSYAYTGNNAQLTLNRNLALDAGAYTYAGNDALLVYTSSIDYTLTCDTGAYSLTGNAATLTYVEGIASVAYTLDCAVGSYTLTGNDADLSYLAGERPSGGYGEANWYIPATLKERKKQLEKDLPIEVIEAIEEVAKLDLPEQSAEIALRIRTQEFDWDRLYFDIQRELQASIRNDLVTSLNELREIQLHQIEMARMSFIQENNRRIAIVMLLH